MKRSTFLLGALALSAGWLAGCDDGTSTSMAITPPPPQPQSDDTAQVLALAQSTGQTSPFTVNGGVFVINDTSETTGPIAINAM